MKFGDICEIYLKLIFWIFLFKIRTKLKFNFILHCLQSYLSPEDLEKSYIHVSDNAFQIGTVTINRNTEIR